MYPKKNERNARRWEIQHMAELKQREDIEYAFVARSVPVRILYKMGGQQTLKMIQ